MTRRRAKLVAAGKAPPSVTKRDSEHISRLRTALNNRPDSYEAAEVPPDMSGDSKPAERRAERSDGS